MEKMDLKISINKKINWESEDSYYFFNPKQKLKEHSFKKLPQRKNRIYVESSGGQKIIGLSKQAFLISAKSVNKHLHCTSKDRWLDVLPFFHVASLSIEARSFCGSFFSGRSEGPWSAENFKEELQSKEITLTSLVPTQVYDLVQKKISSPSRLRAVIVGGASLDPLLYKKARALCWPLLPSYGLTEMASQVATASLSSLEKQEFPALEILPHVQARESSGFIELCSSSLLEGYLDVATNQWREPKAKEAWFKTEDKGKKENHFLKITGRAEDQIKILGELVDLKKLSIHLESFCKDGQLVATPCERNGFQIDFITSLLDFNKISKIVNQFNETVLPFEKIKSIYLVKDIHKGSLFKVKQELLRKQIGF